MRLLSKILSIGLLFMCSCHSPNIEFHLGSPLSPIEGEKEFGVYWSIPVGQTHPPKIKEDFLTEKLDF